MKTNFIKVKNEYNKICYAQISNISYIQEKLQPIVEQKGWGTHETKAMIIFGNNTLIRTQQNVDIIMKLIAKANKQITTNK